MYMCISLSKLGLEAFVDKMDDSPWKPILYDCTDLCYHVFHMYVYNSVHTQSGDGSTVG